MAKVQAEPLQLRWDTNHPADVTPVKQTKSTSTHVSKDRLSTSPASSSGFVLRLGAFHDSASLDRNADQATEWSLPRSEVLIGRAKKCHIHLTDAEISLEHATILHGCVLIDNNSTNGVTVNGEKVKYKDLRHGDVIGLGDVRFLTVIKEKSEPSHRPEETDLLQGIENWEKRLSVGVGESNRRKTMGCPGTQSQSQLSSRAQASHKGGRQKGGKQSAKPKKKGKKSSGAPLSARGAEQRRKRRQTQGASHKKAATARGSEEAEAEYKKRKDFLATMSHEIRNPMNGVIGMTQLLLQSNPSEEQKAYLAAIKQSSTMLMGVINDILDYSKIDAGKFELKEDTFNVRRLVETTETLVRFQLEAKHIQFVCGVGADVPVKLIGDEQRIQQILLNLLNNAQKYTPENGTVTLSVDLKSHEDDIYHIVFSVTDNGVGIAQENLGNIFESFSMVQHGQHGGTGLGLAICNSLVGLMNGFINVSSTLGKGSTFSFEVPLRMCEETAPSRHNSPFNIRAAASSCPSPASSHEIASVATSENTSSASTSQQRIRDGNSLRIIIADDSKINLTVASKLLQRLGHTSVQFTDGQGAVDAYAASLNDGADEPPYDMVFLDVEMVGMDGVEAAQRIRRLSATVPIVAMTGRCDAGELVDQGHFTALLSKPFTIQNIRDIIDEAGKLQ